MPYNPKRSQLNLRAAQKRYECSSKGKRSARRKALARYGLTEGAYTAMITSQNGMCAICRHPQMKGLSLAVDHDHVTHKVRALLCNKCNFVLGLVGDSTDRLLAMVDYLIYHTMPYELRP